MSRGLLKKAVEEKNWDLLDKLLELDNSHVNDNSMFTDTWGEWWSMLYHCVLHNKVVGVKVLLKHGAKRKQRSWGDGMCLSPKEVAEEKGYHKILSLLQSKARPEYHRKTDPEIPEETDKERRVNRQREVANETGLVFNPDAFES
jgi:hypothetical protein